MSSPLLLQQCTFLKGISPKVNVIARLEFELADNDSVVQHFTQYTTTPHQKKDVCPFELLVFDSITWNDLTVCKRIRNAGKKFLVLDSNTWNDSISQVWQ